MHEWVDPLDAGDGRTSCTGGCPRPERVQPCCQLGHEAVATGGIIGRLRNGANVGPNVAERHRLQGDDSWLRTDQVADGLFDVLVLQTSSECAAALPLSFLQYPFQRFHAERLKGGVLVEGELS